MQPAVTFMFDGIVELPVLVICGNEMAIAGWNSVLEEWSKLDVTFLVLYDFELFGAEESWVSEVDKGG